MKDSVVVNKRKIINELAQEIKKENQNLAKLKKRIKLFKLRNLYSTKSNSILGRGFSIRVDDNRRFQKRVSIGENCLIEGSFIFEKDTLSG